MLFATLVFSMILVFAIVLIGSTLVQSRGAVVRALRMEIRPEWSPVPPAACAPRVKRVVRQRTLVMAEWRAAA